MADRVAKLTDLCGVGVDPRLIQQHCARLDADYFDRFCDDQIAEHLRRLSALNRANPVELIVEPDADGRLTVTVLAMDYPSVFSLITGVLAGMRFAIDRGQVFTYAKARSGGSPDAVRRRFGRGRRPIDPFTRRRIIDVFVGRVTGGQADAAWISSLRSRLRSVVEDLETGGDAAVRRAKQRVNELVTESLEEMEIGADQTLLPMTIEADVRGDRTVLEVVSQDTPAFLYAMSTALSLQSLVIERVDITTEDQRIHDRIELVDSTGQAVRDPAVLDRVKFTVLLTKQFTYFLSTAPDPYTALSRYEQMVSDLLKSSATSEWFDQLSNPRAMADLARLLGASDYLWEDFIRLQYEALSPILQSPGADGAYCPPVESLPQRLRDALAQAESFAEKRKALNRFKDREIFLLDLDHILNPNTDFRTLAERLTVLAENVVQAAGELAEQRLIEQYGPPRTACGQPAPWSIFGLGKLGGAALGYASDIELLFVYDGDGQTQGPDTIATGEFHQLFAREVGQSIEAKQEGIFRVDMRLRPYGSNAPLASHIDRFAGYYGPGGDAEAFERLALVRLRAIAGDAELGRRVEALRDQLIYEGEPLDYDQLFEMRRMQYRQKCRDDRFNAKYSAGALVDVEYTVQMLQVREGGAIPELRTPRIHQALAAMARRDVLPADETARLTDCYDFFRQLINALRMLRGSAKDLVVPARDSDEFQYLARRMGYRRRHSLSAGVQLAIDMDTRSAEVRGSVATHFTLDALPDPKAGNLADLMLNARLTDEHRERLLQRLDVRNGYALSDALGQFASSGARHDIAIALMHAWHVIDQPPVRRRVIDRLLRLFARAGNATALAAHLTRHIGLLMAVLTRLGDEHPTSAMLKDDPDALCGVEASGKSIEQLSVELAKGG